MNIEEKMVDTAVDLTEHQKTVLAKITAAPTAKVAGEEISENRYLVTSRDLLAKFGMITYDPQSGEATITDKGRAAMLDSGLLDEDGNLTDIGQEYAQQGSASPQSPEQAKQSFESFELVKEINDLIKFIS